MADKVLPGAPVEWLDMLTARNDWTWYLSGNDVIILPRVKQVDRQLQRQVSLRYQNEPVVNVLLVNLELDKKLGTGFRSDPAAARPKKP